MNRLLALIVLLTAAALADRALAKFRLPPEVPVDRLINNVAAYVKEHPDEAKGYYTLGRIHYLAFSLKSTTVRAYEDDGAALPNLPGFFQEAGKQAPGEAELTKHLDSAAENFVKAVKLDEKNALYHLGLASLMDAAVHGGMELGAVPGADKKGEQSPAGKAAWRGMALAEYVRAYDLSIEKDATIQHRPIHGLRQLVSYEAAQRYAQMIKPEPTDAQKEQLAAMQKRLAPLEHLTGPVTPIIFSLHGADRLGDLLDPANKVRFDMDGTGRGQAWPWVKPRTSILVWDPKASGRIVSGKQLFGTVTWWIFWEDGYQALAGLDDNRDGEVSGDELKGLAVWTDRNANGTSDAGEVISISSAGIEAIQTRSAGRDGESPMNALGLRMKDGRVLATWDWVVEAGR